MRLLLVIAALALASDQASKLWVIHGLGLADIGRMDVFPPYLVFIKGLNTGVNFGLFSGAPDTVRWALVGFAIAASCAVLIWAYRKFETPLEFASGGLLIGGALGNAIDRVYAGGVIDFLNMSCCGIQNPYVFNIADIWVFAGAIGLAAFTGRSSRLTVD